jgi:hypothetical protein
LVAIFIVSMSSTVKDKKERLLALPSVLSAKLLSGLAFWAPVVLAMGFLALVALNGLRPALIEQRRVAERSAQMSMVNQELLSEEAALERTLKAQADPIYRERLRRINFVRMGEAPKASTENRLLSHVEGSAP